MSNYSNTLTNYTDPSAPEDYGHRTRRCRVCNAWLCRYNSHPVCWSHIGTAGPDELVLEIAPGQWRRFHVVGKKEEAEVRSLERKYG